MNQKDNIAEHYNKLENVSFRERSQSKIIHIRNMNNFIKSLLLKEFVKENNSVLDMGCGRGGDLKKMNECKIRKYVGIDFAENSIEEAKKRYKKMVSFFNADFKVIDVYGKRLELNQEFDVISCQFSFHYAFKNLSTLTTAVENVTRHLKNGGYFICTVPCSSTLLRRYHRYGNNFGNEFYQIQFLKSFEEINKMEQKLGVEYYFILEEAVENCIEYLVDENTMLKMFEESGVKLIMRKPFFEYYNENWKKEYDLHIKIIKRKLNVAEQCVVQLYKIFVFQKTGN